MNGIDIANVANISKYIVSTVVSTSVSTKTTSGSGNGSGTGDDFAWFAKDDGRPAELMEPWAYVAAAVTLFFIGFFGFFLNLFVIALMCKDVQLWTPMNIILFNVVCSDFSVSIIGNPFTLSSAISHHWLFGRRICAAYGFFMSLLGITSITTLTVLSYERYCLISLPFSTRNLSRRGAMFAVFFIWCYSFALTSPPLFGWGAYVNEAANISCSVNWESQTTNATTYIIFLFVFGLVVPLAVIIYSYTNIIIVMRRNSARVGRINRAEARVTWMVAVMVIAFMIAWTPYAVFALIEQFGPPDVISPALGVLPALIAKSSICYNPIIYVGMNTQYRAAFSRVRNNESIHNNTTVNQPTKITKSSNDLVECSVDFCHRKPRLKTNHAGGGHHNNNNFRHSEGNNPRPDKAGCVRNALNAIDESRSADCARQLMRSDYELSVIRSSKSILIQSNTFRTHLV
ncbi:vertebrate ancient opsin-like [Malaya genurostris]|uniref:vertebrate ancient opsin-like n=1 Tax=Malaya genurostris TaxID=325434 RepID=UPI0026F3BE56|nr:vertebrate ancient opsin-like [Malaya genurostris]XP_058446174.1 vertebrate ancient opsin-like [Malaya genurostris]